MVLPQSQPSGVVVLLKQSCAWVVLGSQLSNTSLPGGYDCAL